MIRFENYRKSYASKLVLAVPELQLQQGIYWLKGENGIGKTTLLKSIAGLIPFEGTIQLQGISIKREPIRFRQLVNYAEAEPLYPGILTGKDLINFYKQTKQATQEQADELIEIFDIGSFVGERIGTYSSGMAKKLSLVLAFIGKANLILLDEPFITLDQKALHVLPELITAYAQKGSSFIISSHQPFELLVPETIVVADKAISLLRAVC